MGNVWHVIHKYGKNGLSLAKTLDLQQSLFEKKQTRATPHYLILTEHEPVYTCNPWDLNRLPQIVKTSPLPARLEVLSIARGGSITYHGPGQLVCYLVINLKEFGIGPSKLAFLIDEAVIGTISKFGLRGHPKPQDMPIAASGVWIKTKSGALCKIASRGMHVSKGITRFGFALNVNTNLSYFDAIYPCGLDIQMTSMAQETGSPVDMQEVARTLEKNLISDFAKILTGDSP